LRTDWLVRDRIGMFVHFGLYAIAARPDLKARML
jgi:hypothetical protein